MGQFNIFISMPHVVQIFHDIGVDPIGMVEFSAYVFGEELSNRTENEDSRKISIGRLIDMVLNLEGANPATVKDVVDMRRIVLVEVERLENLLLALHTKLDSGERVGGGQDVRFSL